VHLRPIHLAWGLPSFLPFHPHTPPDQQGAVHQQNVPPRRLGYPGLAQPERRRLSLKSELELVQSHVAQKPELRGEVGCACVAREVLLGRIDGAVVSLNISIIINGGGRHGNGSTATKIKQLGCFDQGSEV